MKSDEIRSRFLEFFATHGHRVVRSSPLIPQGDATLLFTNAGMNQFKDVFLGAAKRDYSRAASAQKCVRAGGKRSDIENVGYTNRHLTFFEMLGNFSFGDYFKKDAIRFAWDLLTEGYGLAPDVLYPTVYVEDDEAFALWRDEIGVSEARIGRLGKADNFWAMGDTGPCGPCSEIYYDTGVAGCGQPGCAPGCDCPRFTEVWNLVFMQFDRDASGTLAPLPAPSIDTGMGLERLTMILQGVATVYDTDLLRPLQESVAGSAGVALGQSEESDIALRVIADHLRSTTFLLADGVLPGNDGRGYVLRRIIRRALGFGRRVGLDGPFLHAQTGAVIELMGGPYPELREAREHIAKVVRSEEERFQQTLAYAGRQFEEIAARITGDGGEQIPGDEAFRLYETYGLPLDTLKDMAEVRSLTVDEAGYDAALEETRVRGRASWKGAADETADEVYRGVIGRVGGGFVGYEAIAVDETPIVAILVDQRETASVGEGEMAEIVLAETPFYPEGGGQIGDRGTVSSSDAFAVVEDTKRPIAGLIVHQVRVRRGTLRRDDVVRVEVDGSRRQATAINHSATHLLNAALRSVLGEHVKQAGSLVDTDRLRFDFTHYAKPEAADIARIEAVVNRQVGLNDPVEQAVMPIEEALAKGALAFFGDKYGDTVRVIRMGDFSTELCGGTHVAATGNVGYFKIVASSSVASGVRRIEAITADGAVRRALQDQRTLEEVAGRLHVPTSSLVEHVGALRDDLKSAKRELQELRLKLAAQGTASTTEEPELRTIGAAQVAVRRVAELDRGGMRSLADQLRGKVGSGVVLLGTVRDGGKAALLVSVTKDLTGQVDAGAVVRAMAGVVGGSGGGRRDMAEAGGPDGAKLDAALAHGLAMVERGLTSDQGAG